MNSSNILLELSCEAVLLHHAHVLMDVKDSNTFIGLMRL